MAAAMPEGVVPLAGLVEFAPGAVVSRTLVKGEAGTVTLFAFDAGQGLSEHTAPFDALVLAVEGEASVVVGGKARSVSAGDALLLPSGVPHALVAVRRFKMLLVMIRA
jgi:quercetin dioxygenase-like cupin family protein